MSNEKRKKLRGFSFSINIANVEAFLWTKKLISNLFFLKSAYLLTLALNYTGPKHIWNWGELVEGPVSQNA